MLMQYRLGAFASAWLVALIAWHIDTAKPARGFGILMYHSIDSKPSRYSVSPDTFRSHLEKLYAAGFRTARLSDILDGTVHAHKQKLVVLRFDDSRKSQFRFIKSPDGSLTIDPDCAVAILLDFYHKHPEFGKAAIFCVIPSEGFHQPRYLKQKIQFLLQNGMELANHSWFHKSIKHAHPEDIDEDFGQAMAFWYNLLGIDAKHITMLAPPFGCEPLAQKTKERLTSYAHGSHSFTSRAILYAGRHHDEICPLPGTPGFDAYCLPALEVTRDNFDTILKMLMLAQ